MNRSPLWQQLPLGHEQILIDMQPGFAQRPDADDVGVPQLRTHNISRDGQLDLSEIKRVRVTPAEMEKYAVRKGDVIFNNTNSVEWVGKTTYFDLNDDFVLSNHMTRIRVNTAILEPAFLAFYLNYLWQRGISRRRAKQWVNQAAIDQNDLIKFQILIPPLPEQQQIVAIIREADELRHLRREADARARDLLPALFREMFGDPTRNTKGWPLLPLKEVGLIDRGRSQHRPRDAAHLYDGKYPFVQTGDVANANGWITTYSQTYSEAGLAQSRLWSKGTLCITIAANIAKTAILTFDACFPDSVVGFIPNSKTTVEYVRQWLDEIQDRLEALAPQAAQKNINLEILRNLRIPVPPPSLQQIFSARVSEIQEMFNEQQAMQASVDILLISLLTRAFSGKLTVRWREQHAEELREAAVRRDMLLDLDGTQIGFIERPGSLERAKMERQIAEQVRPAVRQIVQSFAAQSTLNFDITGQIDGLLTNVFAENALFSLASVIKPVLPDLSSVVSETIASSIANLNLGLQVSLANTVAPLTDIAPLRLFEAFDRPMEEFQRSLARYLAETAALINNFAVGLDSPHARRPIFKTLATDTLALLMSADSATTYFRPEDLIEEIERYHKIHGEIQQQEDNKRSNNNGTGLIEAEEGLRLLAALGFVRRVWVRGQVCYRMVDTIGDRAALEL